MLPPREANWLAWCRCERIGSGALVNLFLPTRAFPIAKLGAKATVEWEKGKRPKNPWLDGFCGVSSRQPPPTALNYQIKNDIVARQWHLRGARGTTD